MLTLLLIMAMFGQGQSLVLYGNEFITAFPDNVASFYPYVSRNSLNVTALYNDTEVIVYYQGSPLYDTIMFQGQTQNFSLPWDVEESKLNQSLKTVRVVSSRSIVVMSISVKGDSMQTNVLWPYRSLGWTYSIPILSYSGILSTFYQDPQYVSERYKFFRLLVINAVGSTNNITIIRKTQHSETVELQPWAFLQLQLNDSEIAVGGSYKVAVILAHPCMEMTKCHCNMVVNQLSPDGWWGNNFVVPYINNMTWMHVTESCYWPHSTQAAGTLDPIKSGGQHITTTYPSSLRIISPGIIIEVIPEHLFSACYLVHFGLTYGSVLVIAKTALKSDVYIDSKLLVSNNWVTIADTEYSVASVSLNDRHVIWHPTSKIAVYSFRQMASGTPYGSTAVPLSDNPDPAGCLFYPAAFTVVSQPMSWTESYEYCSTYSDELATPSTEISHMALANFLATAESNEYWIGLRRSLFTLDWYWQDGNHSVDFSYMQWSSGQPGDPTMGMCASIFSNMTWNSVSCCNTFMPICYNRPDYFPMK
ncbi:uncharacterized protein [Misgurnus anguillicaudatus]|uniref:uncharacterized protein n=1 Tax=Misgurnus anguillicaudatus TaxID=75329 RepID=UPI003CCF536E